MARSIASVIESLDGITEQAIADRSPLGYFPSLYRRVTANVRLAIERSAFDDNDRMEQLDIVFANRYLDAYHQFRDRGECSLSWKVAFEQGSNARLIVLQHLLLGMNAHISLDLGIAAASVVDEDEALSLKGDFYAINQILGDLINDTQSRLTRIFGPLNWVDRLLGSVDERLSLFSISYARDKAWNQALELILAKPGQQEVLMAERDRRVAAFAERLIRPQRFSVQLLLFIIRCLERKDTATRIRLLSD